VLKGIRENMLKSDEIGNTFTEADLAMMEKWDSPSSSWAKSGIGLRSASRNR
jgi:hypothetical protein